ncbi:hypothetical protein Tco_1083868 [Tanacetum coccineum]
MAVLKFADLHNMVAFLDKPTESNGLEQILTLMGAKTIAWNEFSSTMASAIICLATNQKFNFFKYIFYNMVKNLEGGVKFLMYPWFVQVFLNKQVKEMSKHKETYATPSHTKKFFTNMKWQGKDFSSRVIPLFPTMMVQAQEEVGEGSANPTDPHHTPTLIQPSTSQLKKKHPRKSKKKNTEVSQPSDSTDDVADENVPTHSNDPLLSAKTAQVKEITSLKKRVKKLEKKKKSRTSGIKRLRKVGSTRRVESSDDARRNDEDLMFDTIVLDDQEVEVEKVVSTAEVTTASVTTTIVDELTLAKTLIEIKAAKPNVVTTDATTTTTIVTRPKAREAKDKGKAKIDEPEKPLKKKDQIMYDQEVALNVQAKLEAELEEKERLARQKKYESNIALIESWDNT